MVERRKIMKYFVKVVSEGKYKDQIVMITRTRKQAESWIEWFNKYDEKNGEKYEYAIEKDED